MHNELEKIRAILAGTDIMSLPNDYPTWKMAEDRMRTLNERTLEGLALIGQLEAVADLVAPYAKRENPA